MPFAVNCNKLLLHTAYSIVSKKGGSMINGSFVLIEIAKKYLFIKREDNGLWDLVGGGFDVDEIDYKGVAIREALEEIGCEIPRKKLQLCAILGQRLKAEVSAQYGGITSGFVFLHTCILWELPQITLSDEHTDWKLFTYEEIIDNYKEFSSGALWEFFAVMTFHEKKTLQEGKLRDRRLWQGTEYS